MLNLKYARLALRWARLKLRFRGRLVTDGLCFIAPDVQLEIGRDATLRLGRWCWIGHGTKLRVHEGEVSIGAKSVLGQECTISAFQHVQIGRECIVADRVMLIDFDHGVVEVERPIRRAIRQCFLQFPLCPSVVVPGLQKDAVVSLHAQEPLFIGAIEFDQLPGNTPQKIPIVTDHNCRKSSRLQYAFEPSNAGQVQVICGFIEEQDIGQPDKALNNRKALAPSPGQGGRIGFEGGEACAAQSFSICRLMIRFGYGRLPHCQFYDRSYGLTSRKGGLLLNVADACSLTHRDVAAIWFQTTLEDLEKRRLARPVGSDQSDPVSLRDGEGNVLEELRDSESLRDLLRVNQWRHFERYK